VFPASNKLEILVEHLSAKCLIQISNNKYKNNKRKYIKLQAAMKYKELQYLLTKTRNNENVFVVIDTLEP